MGEEGEASFLPEERAVTIVTVAAVVRAHIVLVMAATEKHV